MVIEEGGVTLATLYAQSGYDAISVINTDTNQVTTTIPVGGSIFRFNSDASRLYTTSFGEFGVFSVIDTTSNTILGVIPFGNTLRDMVLNLYGTRAYIINQDANSILVIDTISLDVITTINLPSPDATSLVLSPDGSRLFVIGYATPYIDVIDASTNVIMTTLTFNNLVGSLAYTSDGRIYVTNENRTIVILDALTLTQISFITTVEPLGNIVIRSNRAYLGAFLSTYVYDTITNSQISRYVPAGNKFIFSPDGTRLYAARRPDTFGLYAFDVNTNTLIASNGAHVTDLAVTPDGSRIYYSVVGASRINIIDASSFTDIGHIDVGGGYLAMKPVFVEQTFEKQLSTGVLTNNPNHNVTIEFLNNDSSQIARIQYYGFIIVEDGVKTPFIGEVLSLEPFVSTSRTFEAPVNFEIQIGVQNSTDVLSTISYYNNDTNTVILDTQLSRIPNLTISN